MHFSNQTRDGMYIAVYICKHLLALDGGQKMIWLLLYLMLLFLMVSSTLLAGMRKDEADFFMQKAGLFADSVEMEKIEASM